MKIKNLKSGISDKVEMGGRRGESGGAKAKGSVMGERNGNIGNERKAKQKLA